MLFFVLKGVVRPYVVTDVTGPVSSSVSNAASSASELLAVEESSPVVSSVQNDNSAVDMVDSFSPNKQTLSSEQHEVDQVSSGYVIIEPQSDDQETFRHTDGRSAHITGGSDYAGHNCNAPDTNSAAWNSSHERLNLFTDEMLTDISKTITAEHWQLICRVDPHPNIGRVFTCDKFVLLYVENAEMLPISVIYASADRCNVKLSREDFRVGNSFRSCIRLGKQMVGDAIGDTVSNAHTAATQSALNYLISVCPTVVIRDTRYRKVVSDVITPSRVSD